MVRNVLYFCLFFILLIVSTNISIAQSATINIAINFGTIVPSQSNGSITMNRSGTIVSTTNCYALTSTRSGGSVIFSSGSVDRTNISISAVTGTLNGPNGSTITLSVYDPNPVSVSIVRKNKTTTFTHGGILSWSSQLYSGTYTGNYTVTINYQ